MTWTNTNKLLDVEGYEGVKTGTTTPAGNCLVACGSRGEDRLIVVVLGATATDGRYVDARNLFRWAWRERGHKAGWKRVGSERSRSGATGQLRRSSGVSREPESSEASAVNCTHREVIRSPFETRQGLLGFSQTDEGDALAFEDSGSRLTS